MNATGGVQGDLWRRFWRIWAVATAAGCLLAFALAGGAGATSLLMGAGISAVSLLLIRKTARTFIRSALVSSDAVSSRGGRVGRALILGGRLILIALLLKLALMWSGLSLPAFAVGLGYTQAVLVVYSLAGGFPENSPAD
ncbi:MAG: hypothetical protein KatS3mg024_2128 [Armatimonadota bacterium]|nr:MAG: hypothetical protein KatS3mg024_2128 [Armatimonadota bacterium]